MTYSLELLPGTFAVCQLDAAAPLPDWLEGEFVSTTRTPDELSVVCLEDRVPDGIPREGEWRCLRLAGQYDFSEVGILAKLTQTLAAADISVLAIGTFDTDYLLVRENSLDSAIHALQSAGHSVRKTDFRRLQR